MAGLDTCPMHNHFHPLVQIHSAAMGCLVCVQGTARMSSLATPMCTARLMPSQPLQTIAGVLLPIKEASFAEVPLRLY